jgi:diguanylate cyclase (GGDEF)-like protein
MPGSGGVIPQILCGLQSSFSHPGQSQGVARHPPTHGDAGATHMDPRDANDRDQDAARRDRDADAHDLAADARDFTADARDKQADSREEQVGFSTQPGEADLRARVERAAAMRDRREAQGDRTRAANNRRAALSDRVLAALDRATAAIDAPTGAHRRDAGTVELTRELARAKRTGQQYVLAFIDVDHLKGTNDTLGHAAGDQLLRQTAASIRAHLRSYDLIVRFGGDEFVCGLPDMTMAEAANRFSLVNADLGATQQSSVSVGLTELKADDTLQDLIVRADEVMYAERQQLRSARTLDLRSGRDPTRPSSATTAGTT